MEWDTWYLSIQLDAGQVQRMARLCFATAWTLANP
jgi:hypothetical protein